MMMMMMMMMMLMTNVAVTSSEMMERMEGSINACKKPRLSSQRAKLQPSFGTPYMFEIEAIDRRRRKKKRG